jgi:cyanophycinase
MNEELKNYQDNSCPTPTGALVVIGGAEDRGKKPKEDDPEGIKMEVLESFVKLLPQESIHIEVITSAGSSDPEKSFQDYQRAFTKLGASVINHIHHDNREDVDFNQVEQRLRDADGIFIAGGDQLKLTAVYGGTKLLTLLKERYISEGLVIAGTSAGAMALSTPMIYAGVGRDEMINGNVKITTGLEFMRDACIDTHFVDRGRFVRMAQVIATNPGCIGVGIEEDTAIIVRNGTDGEVVGSGVAIFIHGRNTSTTNVTEIEELLTIRGLEVDILSKGETFKLPEINPPHK